MHCKVPGSPYQDLLSKSFWTFSQDRLPTPADRAKREESGVEWRDLEALARGK
jgi:hypothetical protein